MMTDILLILNLDVSHKNHSNEGPPLSDFNFEQAADMWGGNRNRRLSMTDV